MINWDIVVQIAAPIITLVLGVVLDRLFHEKEKLISYLGHVSSFRVTPNEAGQPQYIINTHAVIIRNVGRKTATNVRLGHNFIQHVSVHPDIDYQLRDLPGGGKEILIPSLVPKKEVTISYLYFPPLTWNQINTHVESDFGPAKIVTVVLQSQSPRWLLRVLGALVIIGLVSAVYAAFEIGVWFTT